MVQELEVGGALISNVPVTCSLSLILVGPLDIASPVIFFVEFITFLVESEV